MDKKLLKIVIILVLSVFIVAWLLGRKKEHFDNPYLTNVCDPDLLTNPITIDTPSGQHLEFNPNQLKKNVFVDKTSKRQWQIVKADTDKNQLQVDTTNQASPVMIDPSNMFKYSENCAVYITSRSTNTSDPIFYLTYPSVMTPFHSQPYASIIGKSSNQIWYIQKLSVLQTSDKNLKDLYTLKPEDDPYIITTGLTKPFYYLGISSDGRHTELHSNPTLSDVWFLNILLGTKTPYQFPPKPTFKPMDDVNAYPGQTSDGGGSWMPEYSTIWNGKYIYSETISHHSKQFLEIKIGAPEYGVATGTATDAFNSKTWTLTAVDPNIIYGKNDDDDTELFLRLVPRRIIEKYPQYFKGTGRNFIYAVVKNKDGTQKTLCGKDPSGKDPTNLTAICTQYFEGDNFLSFLAMNDMSPILQNDNFNIPTKIYNEIVNSKPPSIGPMDLSEDKRQYFHDGQQGFTPLYGNNATTSSYTSDISGCAQQVLNDPKADRFLWNSQTTECKIGSIGSWAPIGVSGPSNEYYGSVKKTPRKKLLGNNVNTFVSQSSLSGEKTVEPFKVGNINDCMDHCTNDFACTEIAYNYYNKECTTADYLGSVVSSGATGDVVYKSTNTRVVPNPATQSNYKLTSMGLSYHGDPKNILNTYTLSDAEKQRALDTCANRCDGDPNCDRWTLDASDQKNVMCSTLSMGQQKTIANQPVFSGLKKNFMPVITKADLNTQGRGLPGVDARGNSQLVQNGDIMNNVPVFNNCADQCVKTDTCHVSVYDGTNKTCQLYSINGDYNGAMDSILKLSPGKKPVSTFITNQNISPLIKQALNLTNVKEKFTDFSISAVNNEIVGGKLLSTSKQDTIDGCRNQTLLDGGDGFTYNTNSKTCITYKGGKLQGPSKETHTYSAQLSDEQKATEYRTFPNPDKYRCDFVCAKDWNKKMLDWTKGARWTSQQLDSKGNVFKGDEEGSDQCTCFRTDDQPYEKRDENIYDYAYNKWVSTDGTNSCENVCSKDLTGELAQVSSFVNHDSAGNDIKLPEWMWKGAKAQQASLGNNMIGSVISNNIAPSIGLSGKNPLACLCVADGTTTFSSAPTQPQRGLTNYKFVPKMDGIQSDLKKTNSTDLDQNKVVCDQDPNCSGFVMSKAGTIFKTKNWVGRDQRQKLSLLQNPSGSPTDGSYIKMYTNNLYYSGVHFSNTSTPHYIVNGSPYVDFLNDNNSQLFTLRSLNKNYILIFQADSNFCIYRTSGNTIPNWKIPPVWCSNTPSLNSPGRLRFQDDGNLVIIDAKKGSVWQTITSSMPKGDTYTLSLDDDGVLRQRTSDGSVYWSSIPPTIYDKIKNGKIIKVHIVNKATNAVLQSAQPGDCSTGLDNVTAHVQLSDPNSNNPGMGWRFIKPTTTGSSPNDYFIVSDCNTFLQCPSENSNCIDPYRFPIGSGKADDYESIRIDQIDSTYCKLWSYNKQGYITVSGGCWGGINYDCYLSSVQDDRGDKALWKLVPF